MHNTQPHQAVRIVQVEIAVPADMPCCEVADGLSNVLSGAVCDPDAWVLDWRYTDHQRYAQATADPAEGEIFDLPGDEFGAILDWALSNYAKARVDQLLDRFRQHALTAVRYLAPDHWTDPGTTRELVNDFLMKTLWANGYTGLADEIASLSEQSPENA
ncbi:MAG: hypothetical protein KKB13_11030 [Chloroflexi bacterium]|nr:hypothetical protein [Chloroflexota bacterium]